MPFFYIAREMNTGRLYINKLSNEEREIFKDRINKYEYLRTSQAAYFQAIFTGLFTASILYALTEVVPEFASKIIILDALVVKLMILFLLMILTIIILKPYRKAIAQTQKPVVVSSNTVGTLEGYKIIKGTDGTEYVIANVTDTIEDSPIVEQK